jgi:hypothetical protein
MKRRSHFTFALAIFITITSCGGSSKMSTEDIAGCKELQLVVLETLRDMNSWMDQIPDTEFTRAGFEAGLEIAESMAGLGLKARELSSLTSSSSAKKFYDEIDETFTEAATAVSLSGSSFRDLDGALFQKAGASVQELDTFCDEGTTSAQTKPNLSGG